jgi:small conductance mechanosensitive channel
VENLNLDFLKQPEQWLPVVIDYASALLLAFVIFYVGRFIVGRVVSITQRVMLARKVDETLVNFVCSILRWVLLLFVTIAALSQLGVDTTSLVALLGAAGLAIGLSLQGSLGNLAAGVMLIIFKPFKKGDFVDAGGAMGTVEIDQHLHDDNDDAGQQGNHRAQRRHHRRQHHELFRASDASRRHGVRRVLRR